MVFLESRVFNIDRILLLNPQSIFKLPVVHNTTTTLFQPLRILSRVSTLYFVIMSLVSINLGQFLRNLLLSFITLTFGKLPVICVVNCHSVWIYQMFLHDEFRPLGRLAWIACTFPDLAPEALRPEEPLSPG